MLQKIKNSILVLGVLLLTPTQTYANVSENWLGIKNADLREGKVGFETIPVIILNVTNFLLGLVATVSMIVIIYGALRIGYGAVMDDKEAGKKIVTAGIVGFVISVSGWFIINFIIDNL